MVLFESRSMTANSDLLLRSVTIVTDAIVTSSKALPPAVLTNVRAMVHVRYSEVLPFNSKRERTSCQSNIKDVKKKNPLFLLRPIESEAGEWRRWGGGGVAKTLRLAHTHTVC